MITIQNLSYSYGDGFIFDSASFSVGSGIKTGLVGANGAGKSTLFKLLTGEEIAPAGKIQISGTLTLVPQEVKHDPELEKSETVRDYIDASYKKQDFALKQMLLGLELDTIMLHDSPKALSGGQKTKLALARALIEEPDILLLDEPTNFMDIAGKKWVMNLLRYYPKTLILVSHDLHLMDNSIDKVLAINQHTKKIEEYKGTYSTYLILKAEHDALAKRQIINEQKHIKHMEKGLERMARYKSEKGVRQRTNLKRRIARLKENLPELPKELQKIKIHLSDPAWVGEIPIKAKEVSKSYSNESILENVTISILRGERIALVGPNGAGKSTLIKILVNAMQPDTGEVIRDKNLKIGYYSQEFETFDLQKTLLETVEEKFPLHEEKIRAFLANFLFKGNKVKQKIETLSGGEKTRLSMALLMLNNYNLLILDEPTTYLDVLSQRIILEALKTYKGTMIVVSHTEDFISELTPQRALLLPENEIVDWSPDLLEKVSEV